MYKQMPRYFFNLDFSKRTMYVKLLKYPSRANRRPAGGSKEGACTMQAMRMKKQIKKLFVIQAVAQAA